MKRRITLSIALVMSIVLVSLMSSDSQAQGNRRAVYDTGVITLGQNQILRVTVSGQDGNDQVNLRFRQIRYMEGPCNQGVCKQTVESQTLSDPLTLAPNESAVVNAADYAVWRIQVLSNRPDLLVNAQIIDATTGEVQGIIGVLVAL